MLVRRRSVIIGVIRVECGFWGVCAGGLVYRFV